MWGHLFLLLRDIAVNESDQERVSDSGAIRSGLVPQLRHSAIHKRSLTRRTLPVRRIPALAEALQPPVAGEAPSTGRKVGGCDGEHARSVVPWRWPMHTGECHALARTGAQRDIPSICATIGHRSRSIGCDAFLLPCYDCLRADRHYLCTGDLLPGASAAMLCNRITLGRVRADGNRRSLRELWLRNGRLPDLVEAGILGQRDARAAQGAA
jgi:hypothetical protein